VLKFIRLTPARPCLDLLGGALEFGRFRESRWDEKSGAAMSLFYCSDPIVCANRNVFGTFNVDMLTKIECAETVRLLHDDADICLS